MKYQPFSRTLIATALVLTVSGVQAASQAPVGGENGMVVTAQHLATHVGVDVLKAGGNAVDAAVAVGYALAVVYPAAGNLGGGGFMTVQLADGRKTFLDFREKAPLAATANMYLDKDGNVIEGLSAKGHLAVGVPGTVSGMELALSKYGTLKRAQVIAPAIKLAENGFELEQGDIDLLHTATGEFEKDQDMRGIFLHNGQPMQPGRQGHHHPGGPRQVQDPRTGAYRVRLPWLPCGLGAASKLWRRGDLPDHEHSRGYPMADLGYHSAQGLHYQIEAMRHAYVDRNSYLGDPDFVKNPIEHLLDKNYAAKLRDAIEPQKAGDSQAIKPGVSPHEGNNTTHYSIVDKWGNAVSVTYTLNDWFGAGVGVPNMYGLVQGEANAIAPGKAPLSSMSPTIVTKDGKAVMVVGTPGGSRIITATLLTILNVIDYKMNIQEAVDAPRFHQQWMPETTNLETFAVSPDTQKILESWGHTFAGPQDANHCGDFGRCAVPGRQAGG
ncbi:gamma-glutamyltranspeptidase domain-containing protein [Ditylenchus destructor]|nr:gamma-glutamyltranspeptidase domain-containing protein [Ditylenchus destructor]